MHFVLKVVTNVSQSKVKKSLRGCINRIALSPISTVDKEESFGIAVTFQSPKRLFLLPSEYRRSSCSRFGISVLSPSPFFRLFDRRLKTIKR